MTIRIRKDFGKNGHDHIDGSMGGTTMGEALYEIAKVVQNLASGAEIAKPATGWIQWATKANHVDGEKIVIGPVTFWLDVGGAYVPPGGYNATNVRLNVSGATTANDVAVIGATAINAATLAVSSLAANGAGLTVLVSEVPGAAGNVAITETVAHASFKVAGMSGGHDALAQSFATRFVID